MVRGETNWCLHVSLYSLLSLLSLLPLLSPSAANSHLLIFISLIPFAFSVFTDFVVQSSKDDWMKEAAKYFNGDPNAVYTACLTVCAILLLARSGEDEDDQKRRERRGVGRGCGHVCGVVVCCVWLITRSRLTNMVSFALLASPSSVSTWQWR